MELKVFSIRDSAAEIFNNPFFSRSHGEAERNLSELVKDERTLISKRPEHFDLYYLGTYDDLTGKMELLDSPQHVVKAIQLSPKKGVEHNA